MPNEAANWTLEKKEMESLKLIRETLERFGPDKVATTWTGGKDSTTLLYMLRQVSGGKVPVRVIKIDTGADFPQIYTFVDRLFTAIRWDEQEARKDEQYLSEREDPDHLRVQPLLHFREIDIWSYIRKYELPFCELYRRGYRSLDCAPCTGRGGPSERGARSRDKEAAMQRLREMGYF